MPVDHVYLQRYLVGATWNPCRLGARSVYTTEPCISSLVVPFLQSHIRRVHVCSNLPPALLAEWPGSFTCYGGSVTAVAHKISRSRGGTDTEIRFSTERWPWRTNFSLRSCRDSDPRPFNHESGAVTTELPSLPEDDYLFRIRKNWFLL